LVIALLVILDRSLGSGLLDRFLGISSAIDKGDSSAIRLLIWRQSFTQFLSNPLFGGSLTVKYWEGYPHNILLDVLQATGLLGFIPFMVLLVKGLMAAVSIFKRHREYMWVAVVFLQSFAQNMFSNSVYTASWFWTSLGLLLTLEMSLKIKS